MKLNKILAIIILLMIILNIFIPTITLAVNEEEKTENNTIIEEKENSNNTNNSNITNNTNKDEKVENSTNNESIDNKQNNVDKNDTVTDKNADEKNADEKNADEKNADEKNTDEKNDQKNTYKNTQKIISEPENLTNINTKTELSVSYRTHVENIGWQEYVTDGATSGTSGKALRLEAINIQLQNNTDKNLDIKYQVHVQDIGWQDWKKNGEMAGTEGKALRLEGIKICLENSEDYSIMYRVHVQEIGWQDWKTDGEMAGTEGKALRLEAIEIKIVKKQKKALIHIDTPTNGTKYYNSETSTINVSGWKMANVSNTYIKAYINTDTTPIDSQKIQYYSRPDVINAMTNYGTEKQNPTPGYKFSINTNTLKEGLNTIKIEMWYKDTVLTTATTTFNIDFNLHVQYKTHVEEEGWQDWKTDEQMSGTSGKGLRLEAINIQLLNNTNKNLNIKYQVHVQNIGWQDWKKNGEMAGTSGKSLRLEGIKISLENSEDYSIMYRVHVQDIGWQDWKTDGEMAGTSGKGLRLEAIEIKIVKKVINNMMNIETPTNGISYYAFETSTINVSGWKMANVSNTYIKAYINTDTTPIDSQKIQYYSRPDVINAMTNYGTEKQNPTPGYKFSINTNTLKEGLNKIKIEMWYKDTVLTTATTTFYIDTNPHITYSAHIQEIGWQDWKMDGQMSGTSGKALRVEALKIQLKNVPSTAHIKYKSYIQGTGWTDYVKDGAQTGTTGQEKMIQAVRIEIEGLEGYSVEYQAHVQEIGWQPWVSNGMDAGTINQGLRIEALQIRIIKSENTVVPQIKYSTHNSTNAWTNYCKNGVISGSTTNGIKLDAIKIALENSKSGSVKYRLHVQNIGWLDYAQNNSQAGTANSANGIEAVEIQLSGLDGYSIEYRVYIIGKGWQDWVCDGDIAGTTGQSLQISAIQIKLNIKTYYNKSNFSDLNESKYPGYKSALQKLQQQHPNWTIKIMYTGLKWDDVLKMEEGYSNGEPYSLTQATGNWRDSSDQKSYQGGWYKASRAAIAYMMDPRNSLDQYYVFQFQNLNRSSIENEQSLSNMTNGTYLQNYCSTLVQASKSYNVSAFHLASRMILEQGTSGWSVNGYNYKGVTVYNYANINATGKTNKEIAENGAAFAWSNRWFTPEFCINGTAKWIYDNYLSNGQNTKYFEKYNVITSPYCTHQYMQNIRAANDEGENTAKKLEKAGLLDYSYEFIIPVYENMPSSACPRPST